MTAESNKARTLFKKTWRNAFAIALSRKDVFDRAQKELIIQVPYSQHSTTELLEKLSGTWFMDLNINGARVCFKVIGLIEVVSGHIEFHVTNFRVQYNYYSEHNNFINKCTNKIIHLCRKWTKENMENVVNAEITYDPTKAKKDDEDLYSLNIDVSNVFERGLHTHHVHIDELGIKDGITDHTGEIVRKLLYRSFNVLTTPNSSKDSGWWIKKCEYIRNAYFDNKCFILECNVNYIVMVSSTMAITRGSDV